MLIDLPLALPTLSPPAVCLKTVHHRELRLCRLASRFRFKAAYRIANITSKRFTL
jgi:hypothetical protein